MTIRRLSPLIGSLAAVLFLAGCADDYMMHGDRHDEDSRRHDAPAGDRDHHDAPQNDQDRHDDSPH